MWLCAFIGSNKIKKKNTTKEDGIINTEKKIEDQLLNSFKFYFVATLPLKALLHYAIFLATCLAIAPLRYKLHGSLPSVTCPEMNLPRNVFVAVTVVLSRTDFYSVLATIVATKKLRDMFISGHVTLATIRTTCVETKLREKLQEKLPSVTGPLSRD